MAPVITRDVASSRVLPWVVCSAAGWLIRGAVAFLALVLLGALAAFVYPWLVYYGIIG